MTERKWEKTVDGKEVRKCLCFSRKRNQRRLLTERKWEKIVDEEEAGKT